MTKIKKNLQESNVEPRIFYRVCNAITNQGLWYDINGNFTGLIHNEFNFCKNTSLPMPFDSDVVGYLSATDTLENLFQWFTKEDIIKLQEEEYFITSFIADDYKFYNNHWLINKDTSEIEGRKFIAKRKGNIYSLAEYNLVF